ncbi:hypothetical protein [Actinomadura rupiterrae]|uniref:hypothetical protein n=1 Tax=Actinomadura rupiterrae TaxID=559627 RepID=UPI0020A261DD|nr:hypothetical protein [Actinomadura rupiterrae]MCP2342045.1 hypothetical protein [Actinomadura rupiterrae]
MRALTVGCCYVPDLGQWWFYRAAAGQDQAERLAPTNELIQAEQSVLFALARRARAV